MPKVRFEMILRTMLMSLVIALLASCGTPEPDKVGVTTGQNNNTANNAGSNNAGSNNEATNNTTATNNSVSNNTATTNNTVGPNNTTNTNANNTAQVPCETRANCRADQECVNEFCADLWECASSSFASCTARWVDCDGRNYRFACDESGGNNAPSEWSCSCEVNTVIVDTALFVDNPCAEAGVHYAANHACSWLVPPVSP